MLLNYRLQVFDGKDNTIAFAPRFSVILPTGDVASGLGLDRVGYQVNLPFSKETERWAFHFNAGMTHVPGVTVGVSPVVRAPHPQEARLVRPPDDGNDAGLPPKLHFTNRQIRHDRTSASHSQSRPIDVFYACGIGTVSSSGHPGTAKRSDP